MIFKNLKIILISLIISFVCFEILIRFIEPTKIRTSKRETCHQGDMGKGYFEKDHCYYIFDTTASLTFNSKTGYIPMPNAKGKGYITNNYFARDDLSFEKINNLEKKKILFSGGSTAWGAGNIQDNTITSFLNKLNSEYYTINVGVGGFTLHQEYNFYKDKVHKYKHKIWISFSGANDRYSSYISENYYDNSDMKNLRKKLNKYFQNEKVEKKYKDLVYDEYKIKLFYFLDKILYEDMPTPSFPYPYRKEFERMDYETFKRKFKIDLKIAEQIAEYNNVCFIYALQPDLFSTTKKLSDYEKIIKKNYRSYNMDEHYRKIYDIQKEVLLELSNEDNLNYIIIDNAFKNNQEDLFLDEGHFGSKGNYIIANYINKNLNNLLQKCKLN